MPLRHLILLLACVIVAAGLTIFVAQGFLTPGESFAGMVIVAIAMLIRVLVARR